MPNEVMPPFDEESPFIPTRENTEEKTLNFFNTPASTADHTTRHVVVFLPSFRVRLHLENNVNTNSSADKLNSDNNCQSYALLDDSARRPPRQTNAIASRCLPTVILSPNARNERRIELRSLASTMAFVFLALLTTLALDSSNRALVTSRRLHHKSRNSSEPPTTMSLPRTFKLLFARRTTASRAAASTARIWPQPLIPWPRSSVSLDTRSLLPPRRETRQRIA